MKSIHRDFQFRFIRCVMAASILASGFFIGPLHAERAALTLLSRGYMFSGGGEEVALAPGESRIALNPSMADSFTLSATLDATPFPGDLLLMAEGLAAVFTSDDFNMAIMLQPDYAYFYLGKGDMLMKKEREEEAMEAYRKVAELDTVLNNSSCAMYALLALGEKDKAIDFMNRVIESDPTDCGNYYDAACFYSRIGDLDKSLTNLRTAFEKGFRRFHHVRADDDLEALRQTAGFNALIEEYERLSESETTSASNESPEVSERVEITFTPDGGCVSVKCSINELPLDFIFDTGASIVSLSQVEANFMLKNGYLKREDFVGSGRFVDANGDVSEGTIVNLRNVDFGGLKLKNVRASVERNQKAPLLLGQSVLGRLGSIEIDNPGKKLIITQSKR